MKKTIREPKKLSIETTTVRKLQTELTPQQLEVAHGAAEPRTDGCGSIRTVC